MATSRQQQTIEPRYRSKIWFKARDGKDRHAVVLRVLDGQVIPPHLRELAPSSIAHEKLLLVVAGTKQEPLPHRNEKYVKVEERTRAWVALRLQCTTYFKDSMIEVIPASAVTRIDGVAPPNIAQQLEGLIPTPADDGPE